MLSDILHSFNMEPGFWEICLRLLCAMLVGLIIGTEREYTNRPAGMRTHILVALGACVVAITGQVLFNEYNLLGATPDPARLSAQVITGVGFLGAGTIMREGATVKGLTTAASVWTVACLGIAAGYGYYAVAAAGLIFAFITLTILELVQHHLPGRAHALEEYALECEDITAALSLINDQAQAYHGELQHTLAEKTATGYRVTFHADFHGMGHRRRRERFFAALAAAKEVHTVCRGTEAARQKTH
ncbi:MAG: MgtC/SapB family protein [Oscillospiraceae bacterium]|nr:MgtC/SapB family protein [Oscillospiraceae bacterium]